MDNLQPSPSPQHLGTGCSSTTKWQWVWGAFRGSSGLRYSLRPAERPVPECALKVAKCLVI